jgi:hypothetical protein
VGSNLRQPPAALVSGVLGFTNFLDKLKNDLLPGQAVLLNYSAGCLIISRSLYVAAELGIADHLKSGPKSVAALARETNTDEGALYRILRALSSVGVFTQRGQRFANNAASKFLRSDVEDNLLQWVRYVGAEWHHKQWGDILNCMKDGQDVYRHLYGKRFYEWFAEHPEESATFDAGMTGLSAISDKPIAAAFPFGKFGSVLDVAGGIGGQLATILGAYPTLKGGVLDLEPVIRQAQGKDGPLHRYADRAQFVAGSFFDSIPGGFSLYMLKSIIHNWEDESAVRILRNVANAMPPNGRALIAELVVNQPNKRHFGKLLDIAMLALTGGLERTKKEYAALLQKAGLKLVRVLPTASPYSILEAAKVSPRP